MAKSKQHKRSEKPPANPVGHKTNGAKPAGHTANQAVSLDDFFDEMLVLEAVVYGLCKGLNHHEGELYEDLELAAQVQWNRVKKLLSRFLSRPDAG